MTAPIMLFDVDGTIVDSYPGVTTSFQLALEEAGYALPEGFPIRSILGPPLKSSFTNAGVPESQLEHLRRRYLHFYADEGRWQDYQLYPGMAELLRELAAEGYVLATATSKGEVMTNKLLEHAGLLDLFTVVGTAAEDGSRPTKTHVLAYTIDQLLAKMPDAHISDMVLLGDRIHDIEGAANTGVASIAARWGYGTEEEWAGADYQADTPTDVKEIAHEWPRG